MRKRKKRREREKVRGARRGGVKKREPRWGEEMEERSIEDKDERQGREKKQGMNRELFPLLFYLYFMASASVSLFTIWATVDRF